jgi:hypothetical protein
MVLTGATWAIEKSGQSIDVIGAVLNVIDAMIRDYISWNENEAAEDAAVAKAQQQLQERMTKLLTFQTELMKEDHTDTSRDPMFQMLTQAFGPNAGGQINPADVQNWIAAMRNL